MNTDSTSRNGSLIITLSDTRKADLAAIDRTYQHFTLPFGRVVSFLVVSLGGFHLIGSFSFNGF